MKFATAQLKPFTASIEKNIKAHISAIEKAVEQDADLILFSELSLTGYEPTMAKALAISIDDERLNVFQEISDASSVTVAIGAPTKSIRGVQISLLVFQPHQERRVISKKYLHPDEEPYFVPGDKTETLSISDTNIAIAICYEVNVDQHVMELMLHSPKIYMASVAKSLRSIEPTLLRLQEISKRYSLIVGMVNAVGSADGDVCAGNSVIMESGRTIAQLNSIAEGLLIYDTIIKRFNVIAL